MAGYTDSLGICDGISLLGIRSLYGPVSCPVSCFWAGGDYGGFYGGVTDNDPLPCMHDSGVWNQRKACRMAGGADLLANAYLDAYQNVSSYRIELFYSIYNL